MTLSVSGLILARGPVQVLHGIDLEAGPGEVLCLAGPNGAGKSTLLDAIAGLHPAALGRITVEGLEVGSDATRRLVGALPAVPPLYDQLTAREHLELLARLWGLPDATVDEAAYGMRLGETLDLPAGQLSLGQRQRLAVAMVTLHHPTVLLLDEPFNGLDATTAALLRSTVARTAETGGTVLVATHLAESLEGVATRLVYLHEGRVLHDVPLALGAPVSLAQRMSTIAVELTAW